MSNYTIAKRIIAMVLLSLLALLTVGGVGIFSTAQSTAGIKKINDDSLASIQTLSQALDGFMVIRINLYALAMSEDATEQAGYLKRIQDGTEIAQKKLKDYEKLISNPEDQKLLDACNSNIKAYLEVVNNKIVPLVKNKQTEAARKAVLVDGKPLGAKARAAFDAHITFNTKLAEQTYNDALANANKSKLISIVTILAGFASIALLGFLLVKELRFRLNRFKNLMEQISQTLDFTIRLPFPRMDELGAAVFAFNSLLERLQGNLQTIASSSQSVATAAHQMAIASSQVARTSHQQSEAAAGMAATVEEMTVSINHVGDRAQEANRLSSESGQLAVDGNAVISQTVERIHHIASTVHNAAESIQQLENHSSNISSVIAVIKEIADQTNLLALNAAIEAARAGEQGRGFAVVADEVRKLAERTSSSTQEIAQTIQTMRTSAADAVRNMEDAVVEVNQGVEKAQEANDSIQKIGGSSRAAVSMVEEITTAIREQGAATNNIAVNVERIAQMSEESSVAAAQSAQTAETLDRLANEMRTIVAAYKL